MRLLAICALLVSTISPALAEEWDFVLINDTGKSIKEVDISPVGTTDWKSGLGSEDDRTVKELKSKSRTTVRLNKPSGQCRYDIRVTYNDGEEQIFKTANICDNSYITLRITGQKPVISSS